MDSREALEQLAAALKRRSRMRRQISRFNGPLPGCNIRERHASGKCSQCQAVRQRNFRRWGTTIAP